MLEPLNEAQVSNVSKSKERFRSMSVRSIDADFRSLIRRTHISISDLMIWDILVNYKIAA